MTEGGEGGGPMTLTLDQPTVKAGETTVMVHNDAMTEGHEIGAREVEVTRPDGSHRQREASGGREQA